jgi:cytochrome b561
MEEISRQGVRQLPRRNPREISGFGVEAVYLAIFAHLGAVTKHRFGERRSPDVRRMLR